MMTDRAREPSCRQRDRSCANRTACGLGKFGKVSQVMDSENGPDGKPEMLIYQAEDGKSRIQVRLAEGTVWLSQAHMAGLFQTTPQNVTIHIGEIYGDGEVSEAATCKELLQVRQEGGRAVRRRIKFYNLDLILAVGYRVRSPRGVLFRQWATERLREYLVKGFTLDDDRLKGRDRLSDYFDELLARIREIRASEVRVYQRIREIFALAADYVEGQQEAQVFFATMQNKMHYAASGLTAAEIVRRRADARKVNMGLTGWSGSRVLKRDVTTAKNYLNEKEIDTLNRIVVMFLDQAEFRAQRRQDIKMRDWTALLDKFLRDTELPVLADAGTVARDEAFSWANTQYDAFVERRRSEAEARSGEGYLDDLRTSAKTLEAERKKLPGTEKKGRKLKGRSKTEKRSAP